MLLIATDLCSRISWNSAKILEPFLNFKISWNLKHFNDLPTLTKPLFCLFQVSPFCFVTLLINTWMKSSLESKWMETLDLISCWKETTTLASVAHERPSQVLLNWLEALIRHQQLWWPPKLASSSYSKSSYFGIWQRLSKLAHRSVPANGKMVSRNVFLCETDKVYMSK